MKFKIKFKDEEYPSANREYTSDENLLEKTLIGFIYNDGGRLAAGFKGGTGDCVTRAIAIVTGKPYKEVYDALNELSEPFNQKHCKPKRTKRGVKIYRRCAARTGVHKPVYHKYLLSLGMKWIPTMFIGQGCKVHLRADELPAGKLIVSVSKHLTAVIDGVVNDTFNPAREGTVVEYGHGKDYGKVITREAGRCVYGYFSF